MTETEKRIEEIKSRIEGNNIGDWNLISDIEFLLDQLERYKKALELCKEQRDDFAWKYDDESHEIESYNCDLEINKILEGNE